MGSFRKKFFPEVYKKMKVDTEGSNYCKFNSQLLTLFPSSLYVSGLVAFLIVAPITRKYGRKPFIIIGGACSLAGAVMGATASNIHMLVFARLPLGTSLGFANQPVLLYISEMAPTKYRGAVNHFFQLSVQVGGVSANLINFATQKVDGGWGWRISLAGAALPASILTLAAIILPETPNNVIQQNDSNKAKLILQRVRGTANVKAELDDLIKANSNAKTIKQSLEQIIQRRYRPQLVMAVAIPFFQQVTGINVLSFCTPILFRTIGLSESASLMSAIVTGVFGMGSTLLSVAIVDKLGRKLLFIVGGIQMLLSLAAVGGIMAAELGDHGGMSKGYAILVLVLVCVYVVGYGSSWGPLGWLVASDIFPLEIRSAGQSIAVVVSFLFTFIVLQTSLAMLCHLRSGIFFFYGGWLGIMTAAVYYLLPETKNVPIETDGESVEGALILEENSG